MSKAESRSAGFRKLLRNALPVAVLQGGLQRLHAGFGILPNPPIGQRCEQHKAPRHLHGIVMLNPGPVSFRREDKSSGEK